jgi:transcription-repair coupling factor (superfamily II helicase)
MLDLNQGKFAGLRGSAQSWLVACLTKRAGQAAVITPTELSAEKLLRDLNFFLPRDCKVLHFPALDTLPFDSVSPQSDIVAARINTLSALAKGDYRVLVASGIALSQKIISNQNLELLSLNLAIGQAVKRDSLKIKLLAMGYKIVSLVEEIGEIAIRGNVIDIFSPASKVPLRIELQEGSVYSIKLFDPETQRSDEPIQKIEILPIREFSGVILENSPRSLDLCLNSIKQRASTLEVPPREIDLILESIKTGTYLPGMELYSCYTNDTLVSLFEYLHPRTQLIIHEEQQVHEQTEEFQKIIEERYHRFVSEHRLIPTKEDLYLSPSDLNDKISLFTRKSTAELTLAATEDRPVIIQSLSNIDVATRLKSKTGSGEAFAPLIESLSHWRHEGLKIAFVVGTKNRAERLSKILLHYGVLPDLLELSGLNWINQANMHPVSILVGTLDEGFRLPAQEIAFVSESEIFFERTYRAAPSKVRSIKRFMSALAQLSDGDYLVHLDYGVGIYKGLVHIEVENKGRDFLHIEYAGGTKLYLPIENIGKVQKFISKDGAKPHLDKLGSTKWESKKAKVRQAIVALAGELIKLYAARKAVRGWRFDRPGAEDERFADGFGFIETADQQKAITETFSDMHAEKPMDRLVCGDAGFGKTEVALRAAFKAVQHNKQVAVLVPTTILAEQHFNTFRNRFREYPVKIGILSRFYSAKNNAQTLLGIKNGTIDIVVGTHKLIQNSVEFKDLGLLIIDEEHRFGVKHKEKLKQIKKDIDVLTLTATPIPRTLHMALLGIREISVIATPPHDRRVIRTYVGTQNDDLLRDAIIRELQRGGQTFILHNKVQTIDTVTASLQKLVPEAKFTFAHGQMKEEHLEKIMLKFINKEFDVLVSTTIIESGLDIPNANTIIILRADQLGLAQLYQLRGRVGRSNKQAYAYLIVPETKKLTEEARSRLSALQSLDDLGLGFNLAARDLEIRGAGDLLGKDQSGNVQSVGLDMFNRILKEAILNMRGEELPIVEAVDPEMRIPVDAFIPPNYIPDLSERLILYQRLADLFNDQACWDLSEEIEDRFGKAPDAMQNLIQLMRLRSLIRLAGAVRIEFHRYQVSLQFSPKAPLSREKINKIIGQFPDLYSQKSTLTFQIRVEHEIIDNPGDLVHPIKQFLGHISDNTSQW